MGGGDRARRCSHIAVIRRILPKPKVSWEYTSALMDLSRWNRVLSPVSKESAPLPPAGYSLVLGGAKPLSALVTHHPPMVEPCYGVNKFAAGAESQSLAGDNSLPWSWVQLPRLAPVPKFASILIMIRSGCAPLFPINREPMIISRFICEAVDLGQLLRNARINYSCGMQKWITNYSHAQKACKLC